MAASSLKFYVNTNCITVLCALHAFRPYQSTVKFIANNETVSVMFFSVEVDATPECSKKAESSKIDEKEEPMDCSLPPSTTATSSANEGLVQAAPAVVDS